MIDDVLEEADSNSIEDSEDSEDELKVQTFKPKIFSCDLCDKKYSAKGSLKNHEKTHYSK